MSRHLTAMPRFLPDAAPDADDYPGPAAAPPGELSDKEWAARQSAELMADAGRMNAKAQAERERVAAVPLPKFKTALPADNPAYAAALARTAELREKAAAALEKAEARQAAYNAQYGPEAERALARALLDGAPVGFVPKPEVEGLAFEARNAKAAAELADRRAAEVRRSISAEVRAEVAPALAEMQRQAFDAAERFAEAESRIDDLFRAMTARGYDAGDFRTPGNFDVKAYRQALARSFARPFEGGGKS